jgi:hypothetical protein
LEDLVGFFLIVLLFLFSHLKGPSVGFLEHGVVMLSVGFFEHGFVLSKWLQPENGIFFIVIFYSVFLLHHGPN